MTLGSVHFAMAWLFGRKTTVGIPFSHALIALVRQAQLLWKQGKAMQLEQAKIMDTPFLEGSADDLTVGLMRNDLCFQCMVLLLATQTDARM